MSDAPFKEAGKLEGDMTSSDELTLYKSMGHAVEDVAAAALVLASAAELGVGTRVRL